MTRRAASFPSRWIGWRNRKFATPFLLRGRFIGVRARLVVPAFQENGFAISPCRDAWAFQLRALSFLHALSPESENYIAPSALIWSTRMAHSPAVTPQCFSKANWTFLMWFLSMGSMICP